MHFIVCLIVIAQAIAQSEYGLVMDAGSSGTRIYVYTWLQRTNYRQFPDVNSAPIGQPQWSKKKTPGISAFASNTTGLIDYFTDLISFATDHIPIEVQKSTPLYLKATAGMRLLTEEEIASILSVVRTVLGETVFSFKSAEVISGEEEGVFGWLTVNSLLHNLDSVSKTVGAVDMGGASMQVTFVSTERPLSNYFDLHVATSTYPLYTHSYLTFGNDQAAARLYDVLVGNNDEGQNPCFFGGFNKNFTSTSGRQVNLTGTADYNNCKTETKNLLELNVYCPARPCAINGIYQPAIPNNMTMYLFSTFLNVADFFNCTGAQRVDCMDSKAQTLCTLSWQEAQQLYPPAQYPFLEQYCFQAAFTYAVATDGLKLTPDRVVQYAKDIDDVEIGWALGSMYYEVGALDVPDTPVPEFDKTPFWIAIGGLGGVLLFSWLLFVITIRRLQLRNSYPSLLHPIASGRPTDASV
eukprot:TRINITY_DN1562_c0_g1_i2.p1 TRINITY_DN1562_c0_g1~~TRINITY_DN1562_c0_g1_i2.p1  ORF type:complete len:466 (-),score=62.89 TRINITY_DN1562_c0_g1_i2:191-1588(-)